MKQSASILWMVCTLIMVNWQSAAAQTIQEVMDTATLENQLIFVQEHTRIYDNFRAIREDVFQKMKNLKP